MTPGNRMRRLYRRDALTAAVAGLVFLHFTLPDHEMLATVIFNLCWLWEDDL